MTTITTTTRKKVYLRLLNLIKENKNGFTANEKGHLLNLKKGYAVSITNNKEKKINDLINKALALNHLSINKFYFGGWYDNNEKTYYLDLTKVINSKQKALQTAKQFNQKAIFCFKTLNEIKVK